MAQAESADQPALGPDGQLRDASELTWHHDPADPNPIQPTSSSCGQRSRPIRATAGIRLAEAIAAEKLDEFGSSCRRFIPARDAKASAKCKRPTTTQPCGDAIDTDTEDETFAISVSEGEHDGDSLDSGSDDIGIGNEEVCIIIS